MIFDIVGKKEVNMIGFRYDETTHDMFIPLFGILKFIFYFGWLNVAETLINPFGEDDEDFDVNYLINRNFQLVQLDQSSLFGNNYNQYHSDFIFHKSSKTVNVLLGTFRSAT